MSASAPFLGKVFICRGGNYNDRYVLDGIGGTHVLLNIYANGRNEGPNFTGVTCQGVEPVVGAGKPSDLKHLTRGVARIGETPGYVPLVSGAGADTRTFGIDVTQKPHLFVSHYLADATIPNLTPAQAAFLESIKERSPEGYHRIVETYLGAFACRSYFKFGDIYWWWGAGWLPVGVMNPISNPTFDQTGVCSIYSLTPSAADWRKGDTGFPRVHPGTDYGPGTDYEWCDLSGEDYSHLALPDARFSNADLTGTDFTGCDLSRADFHAVHSMKQAKLTNAKLDGANLSGVDLDGVDLSGASLLGTDLSHTNLTKAIFNAPPTLSHDINARTSFAHSTVPWKALHDPVRDNDKIDLTALVLAYALLPDAPTNLHGLDASNADVRGVVLSACNLQRAKFVHARAEAIDLSGSMLAFASFEYAFLGSDGNMAASLANTNLMDADFSNADLTGAVLTGAYLWGSSATLAKATLQQTNFSGAYLVAADFREIAGKQCSGVDFSGACLVNADFRGTTTQVFGSAPTNFVNACLQGANFEGAKLIDTTLSHATVSFESGTFGATVPMGWPPRKIQLMPSLQYDATKGLTAATTATTTCPSGGNGPCTGDQLRITNPVTQWPPPG